MTQQNEISELYELGKAHSNKYNSVREATMYGALDRYGWALPKEYMVAYTAGFDGCEMPRKVTGWRYGNIPANGAWSYNYRDDHQEAGVSLMATDDGEETQDAISAVFIANGRQIVKVEGWLNTVKTGSDGEPLVFWAKEIE